MKHLKKLSVVLMLTALFSVTFTSCIDNEVSPLVEAIYEAQADLIAAQANLQNAEAEYFMAQAAAESAAADELNAITARYVAMTAIELREATAAADLAVEEARIAMLLAQAEFDQDLVEIAAAIRAAANVEAGVHAVDYATAMGELAILKGEKLALLQSIATKELYMKSVVVDAEMTWEVYLAGLQRDVLAKEASVAANEAYIVRANAYLDGDVVAMQAALDVANAAVTAKQAEIDALLAEDIQIDADIATNFVTFKSNYEALVGELDGYKASLKAQQDTAAELNTITIPGLEDAIADYAGTTTTLTDAADIADAAEVTADDNVADAEAALGTSLGTPSAGGTASVLTTLYAALWNAELVTANAVADSIALQIDVDALNLSYQNAIADYALAQSNYDLGAAGLTAAKAAADLALTTGQALVITNQADYDAKKAVFEANPTGFVWTGGVDGVLGIHADATTVTNSYKIATSVGPVVVGATTLSAGAGSNLTALGTYASFLAGTMDGGGAEIVAVDDYYNVGLDDVAGGTNADRLDDALVALTVAIDAIPTLETAVADAQANIDDADGILADAKELFEDQRDLYEDQVTLLEAAGNVIAAANGDEAIALLAVTDAEAALGTVEAVAAVAGDTPIDPAVTLYELLWNAQLAALDANAALNAHTATTLAAYEAQLVSAQADLVTANNYIAEYEILVTRWTADVAALTAEYDALVATPLYAAQQVRILEIADEIAVLTAEKAVLTAEAAALAITINFEGSTTTGAIDAAIIAAQAIIDAAPAELDILAAQIAQGNVTVANLVAEVAKLKLDLVALDAQIAAKAAEAAGYLALMEAALAS